MHKQRWTVHGLVLFLLLLILLLPPKDWTWPRLPPPPLGELVVLVMVLEEFVFTSHWGW